MTEVNDLFARHFLGAGIEVRSEAYQRGARAALARMLEGGLSPAVACTYAAGTPERDAWLAGWDAGRRVGQTHLEGQDRD